MRGAKLKAWRIPPIWETLNENVLVIPEGSTVPQKQEKMLRATYEVLMAVAKDIREGLLETVGVDSTLSMIDGRCSMVLQLPDGGDTEKIAGAIDMENVEAWRDEPGKVHIGVSPWYSTKDVDQTVLSAVKVVHVMLGIHATDNKAAKPKTLRQKLLSSVMDVMQIQKSVDKGRD